MIDVMVGQRVEAHPATNAWIMGARFGTVKGFTKKFLPGTETYGIRVKLDRVRRVQTFHPDNLWIV